MAAICSSSIIGSRLAGHGKQGELYRRRGLVGRRRRLHVGKMPFSVAKKYLVYNPLWQSGFWSNFGKGDARTNVYRVNCSDLFNHQPEIVDNRDQPVNPEGNDLLPKLDAVVVQTVSSTGEIEHPAPIEQTVSDQSTALKTVVFWVCAAVIFGSIIWLKDGSSKASEFLAGYLVEQSLSVDNLFIFVLIFKYFHVPPSYQSRVLTYGIFGAIVFRAIVCFLGVAAFQRFEAANLIFAGVLLFSSYKLFSVSEEEKDLSNNFIVNTCRRFIPVAGAYDGNKFFTKIEGTQKATPLLLTLAVVEFSDIAFALDSIPAVFGITKDLFIVLSSNIFAVLGLRSLYTLISSSMDELEYLQPSVALVLGFIGSKMVTDYFGFHVPTEVSLGVVVSVLGIGIGLSIWNKEKDCKN
eukprot:c22780_g1_i1 orf=397-1620(+)